MKRHDRFCDCATPGGSVDAQALRTWQAQNQWFTKPHRMAFVQSPTSPNWLSLLTPFHSTVFLPNQTGYVTTKSLQVGYIRPLLSPCHPGPTLRPGSRKSPHRPGPRFTYKQTPGASVCSEAEDQNLPAACRPWVNWFLLTRPLPYLLHFPILCTVVTSWAPHSWRVGGREVPGPWISLGL